MTNTGGGLGAPPRTALPALGVAAIWLFLLVFLVYPLARIFYDAVTDEAGRLTVAHFVEFARDRFYQRSLVNSLLLGLGTMANPRAEVAATVPRPPRLWGSPSRSCSSATSSLGATSSATSR